MQAAVDLYFKPNANVGAYILVGGGLNGPASIRWHKTDNMRSFLVKNDVPEDIITCIASEPDTLGNLRAVWKIYHNLVEHQTVGILTNAYHIERTMTMITDMQFDWHGAQFVALPAEDHILAGTVPSHSVRSSALIERVNVEQQGLRDWHAGTYVHQHTPRSQWRGELRQTSGASRQFTV